MCRDDALLLLSYHEVHLEDLKSDPVIRLEAVRWHRRRRDFWQTVISLDDVLDLAVGGDWGTFDPAVEPREKVVLERLSA